MHRLISFGQVFRRRVFSCSAVGKLFLPLCQISIVRIRLDFQLADASRCLDMFDFLVVGCCSLCCARYLPTYELDQPVTSRTARRTAYTLDFMRMYFARASLLVCQSTVSAIVLPASPSHDTSLAQDAVQDYSQLL